MQFFWLYMDELIGKGLGIWMILQLLFYMSSTMVPMALPLGILLASIMTFGNLGENFELIAIKSAGISLNRFLRPLLFVIIGMSGVAFFFNNNIIPVANLKALSLLYDMRNSKPTLNIKAGQFNGDIQGYSIRVGEKDKDGHTITNVMVYDHTSGYGNDNVVLAKKGEMIASPNKQYLIFRLMDGWRYEELNKNGATKNYDQMRMHFQRWDKVFDLSGFKLSRTNEDLFKGAYQMMNLSQLNKEIDTLAKARRRIGNNVASYLSPYVSIIMPLENTKSLPQKIEKDKALTRKYDSSFMQLVPDTLRAKVAQIAMSHVRNTKGLVDMTASEQKAAREKYQLYNIEWHRKFTLSFACILLFLIGAPLGSIIRKGGLGMPLIIAILFFIVFHILSITGEKLAKTSAVTPIFGMWMASLALSPIALLLINAARKDSQVFNKELYMRLWRWLQQLFLKDKNVAS